MAHALPADVLAMLGALRRRPDVEAPELVAADAADRLVLAEARELLASSGPGEVVVLDDGYGALALGALALGAADVRVATDTVTSERAIRLNTAEVASLGLPVEPSRVNLAAPLDPASVASPGLPADPSRMHLAAPLDPESVASPGLPADPSRMHLVAPLDPASVAGARVVLARLPRSLDALAELADLVADHAAPDVVLLATGRLKHMSRSMNDVLAVRFAEVSATLAHGKARALVARRPVAAPPGHVRFPRRAQVAVPGSARGATGARPDARPGASDERGAVERLVVVAHGAAFAGPSLDIGTRALLDAFDGLLDGALERSGRAGTPGGADEHASSSDVGADADAQAQAPTPALQVLDLGCGTGVLATVVALRVPSAHVVATDRSAAAVLSAAATAAANGVGDRVTTLHDDAAASVPDASVDVVVCNPPFHAGAVVSTDIAEAMFRAAARVLRPGGELWVVWNSHLRYRPSLERVVGPTTQVSRTPKFTVTRSVRR